MNDEQHLTYELGMTNVPSDATCDDNGLEESIGLTYADGEHRVIQKPAEQSGYNLATGETLLYIHAFNNVTRLIIRTSTNVVWRLKGSQPSSNVTIAAHNNQKVLVESIGNTLIVSTSSGLRYLLWDYTNNTYKNLGNKIPDIRLNFTIDAPTEIEYPEKYISLEGMLDGIEFVPSPVGACGFAIKNGQYENFKNAMIGLLTSRLNNIKEKGRFAFPFWVRYAIRMYDGQHINISNPFLIMPTVNNNWWIFMSKEDGTEFDTHTGDWSDANYKPLSSKLYFTINTGGVNLNNWTDIINGVDIFVSDEVKNFDMGGQWEVLNTADANSPVCTTPVTMADSCQPSYTTKKTSPVFNPNDQSTWRTYFRPTLRSDQDIINSLISSSSFYKIIELDMDDLAQSGTVDASSKIAGNVLKNLVNQTQLEYDDYFSRTNIVPQVMKTYNHRLHMANVTRDFFNGFTRFSYTQYPNSGATRTMSFYVHIKTDSGERIVEAENQQVPEIEDVWFYYPDPRAYKVDIFRDGTGVKNLSLKEHPYLNGAYCFKRLPKAGDTPPTTTMSVPTVNNSPELLEDQLLVSEVNNPYIYTSRGYVNVGMGVITALAAQTMSLGENEHGIHPLLVFTEKGISMLRVTNEGTYSRSDESSREVANPSNPCVIETDGPVFFASKKGLMVAIGSGDGLKTRCVSEQLSGKTPANQEAFVTFLQEAVIAYDYRDGLLWIFNDESNYAWIYNIKSGTFGRYEVDVEQQQVQQQAAPLLQSSPRRSASNNLAFVTLPFTGSHTMDGTENTDNDISHLDTSSPVELYYAGDAIKKFYLKGISTVDSQETYFTEDWTFEGHTEREYYNLYGAIMPGTLFLDDNGHYWVQGGANAVLIDLGTTNPALWDQLPITGTGGSIFSGGENVVSYSDVDLNEPVSLNWTTNIPSGNRWVLKGKDQNGNTCYVLDGWTYQNHADSEYYDDITTHTIKTGVLFVDSFEQYKLATTGNIFRTLTVAQEPTPTEYITPSVNSLSFAQAGETKTFDISSNVSWAISKSSGSDWLTVSPDSGSNDDTISVVAAANSGDSSRTATLTISDGTISATVSISQAGTSPTPPTPTPVDKITVVNNYPDYLIQLDDVVYSLIERDNINDDNKSYAASMITRALKLGGGLTLKSIMRMKNIFDIHSGGTLSVEIWAKNNLNDAWVQLTHLRGVPHKYYQLRYTFTGLLATDRFAGTVLITQERRTNKLR